MNQKAALKQWIRTNESYFHSNPEALKSLMNDPTFLNRFNQRISVKRKRIERKLARIEQRNQSVRRVPRASGARIKQGSPFSLKLPSLSTMSERLGQMNEMIGVFRELTGK